MKHSENKSDESMPAATPAEPTARQPLESDAERIINLVGQLVAEAIAKVEQMDGSVAARLGYITTTGLCMDLKRARGAIEILKKTHGQ